MVRLWAAGLHALMEESEGDVPRALLESAILALLHDTTLRADSLSSLHPKGSRLLEKDYFEHILLGTEMMCVSKEQVPQAANHRTVLPRSIWHKTVAT